MTPTELRLEQPWLHVRPYHGEGVVWFDESLYFVDINRGRVYRFHTPSAALSWFEVPGSMVGAVHPSRDGGLVLADSDGIALYSPSGTLIRRLASPLLDHPDLRMNDANVDPQGRYLGGSMALDHRPGAGRLWSLGLDGVLTTVVDDATISNGLDWSPDGSLMYYVDTPLRRIDVFSYDVSSGAVADRRTFVDVSGVDGFPDGLTVDAEGGVWVAFIHGGRVCRFSPSGSLTFTVHLPVSLPTSCCFGGPELDQLYISTSTENMSADEVAAAPAAGAIFAARTPWSGRPATPAAAFP